MRAQLGGESRGSRPPCSALPEETVEYWTKLISGGLSGQNDQIG